MASVCKKCVKSSLKFKNQTGWDGAGTRQHCSGIKRSIGATLSKNSQRVQSFTLKKQTWHEHILYIKREVNVANVSKTITFRSTLHAARHFSRISRARRRAARPRSAFARSCNHTAPQTQQTQGLVLESARPTIGHHIPCELDMKRLRREVVRRDDFACVGMACVPVTLLSLPSRFTAFAPPLAPTAVANAEDGSASSTGDCNCWEDSSQSTRPISKVSCNTTQKKTQKI